MKKRTIGEGNKLKEGKAGNRRVVVVGSGCETRTPQTSPVRELANTKEGKGMNG